MKSAKEMYDDGLGAIIAFRAPFNHLQLSRFPKRVVERTLLSCGWMFTLGDLRPRILSLKHEHLTAGIRYPTPTGFSVRDLSDTIDRHLTVTHGEAFTEALYRRLMLMGLGACILVAAQHTRVTYYLEELRDPPQIATLDNVISYLDYVVSNLFLDLKSQRSRITISVMQFVLYALATSIVAEKRHFPKEPLSSTVDLQALAHCTEESIAIASSTFTQRDPENFINLVEKYDIYAFIMFGTVFNYTSLSKMIVHEKINNVRTKAKWSWRKQVSLVAGLSHLADAYAGALTVPNNNAVRQLEQVLEDPETSPLQRRTASKMKEDVTVTRLVSRHVWSLWTMCLDEAKGVAIFRAADTDTVSAQVLAQLLTIVLLVEATIAVKLALYNAIQ